VRPGPRTREQLRRLGREWKQGEHMLISGGTGSGKTALARPIVQLRIDRGGYVVVLCMKPLEDRTIVEDYADFTRWKRWKKRPGPHENKILLWPDVSKAKGNRDRIIEIQREIFSEAFDGINAAGHWTVQVDEGLYATAASFLGKANDIAMGHAIGRSGNLTWVTLTQRPAHLPLILYGSASHALVGRTREASDLKRLAELGGRDGSRELARRVSELDRHDFLWVPVAPDWPSEVINLSR